MAELAEENMTL